MVSSIWRYYLPPHLGMHDFRKYSTPYEANYGLNTGRTALVSTVAVRIIVGWGSFPVSLRHSGRCVVGGSTECHGLPECEPVESCAAPAVSRWCESLENPSPLGFPNLLWFNCFRRAEGHSSNFELVKSEIKSEINLKRCSYRLFLSYLPNYLFSLYTGAYFTFWVDIVVYVKIISSWTP